MENLKKKIDTIVDIYKSGGLKKAELLCKELLIKNSNIVFLYNLLGLILVEQKKIDLAIECYEKGIKIDPNFAMIYNNLGLLFTENKFDEKKGENFYKKSISLDQKIPEPYNNLGSLYKSQDKFDEAIECFTKAITIDPKFVHAYHNLGNVYIILGNFSDARKNFEEALGINSKYTSSHRALSRLNKYTQDHKHFNELKKIYEKININDIENKTNLAFALGKAYEDIKEYDKSFSFYNQANVLYRKKINFSMKNVSNKCERIKDTFHKKIFEKYLNCGCNDSSPIFILGMPRSGTTLVEQILSNHPNVYGGDEQVLIVNLLQKNFKNKNLRLFFENIIEFDKNDFKRIGEEYINRMKIISRNSEKTTDKMPENFYWIGFIKLILPQSKIIHCYRNSKDNCLSLFKNHFPGGKINYSYDLNHIVEYYNLYYDLMYHWNNLLPNFIFNIKYENLISNTKDEIINLLKFSNLEWDDKCLHFHNNKRAVKTASDVQARSKIYTSSIDSWKKYEKYLNEYFQKLNA